MLTFKTLDGYEVSVPHHAIHSVWRATKGAEWLLCFEGNIHHFSDIEAMHYVGAESIGYKIIELWHDWRAQSEEELDTPPSGGRQK